VGSKISMDWNVSRWEPFGFAYCELCLMTLTVTCIRPVAGRLMTWFHCPQILYLQRGLKTGVLGETLIFKIIMIDDVTLCAKFESAW